MKKKINYQSLSDKNPTVEALNKTKKPKRKARKFFITEDDEVGFQVWENEEEMNDYIGEVCPKCTPVQVIEVKEVLKRRRI